MRIRSAPVALFLVASLAYADAAPPRLPSSAAISQETQRSHRSGSRVITFWWLPVEYWLAAARELKKPEEEVERLRSLLHVYIVLAVVDADVGLDGGVRFSTLEDANERLTVLRNGRETRPVTRLDPEIARVLPELAYFMTASLQVLAPGLRLILVPNIDDDGKPVVTGATSGEIVARYVVEGDEAISWIWRAPLTSVRGPRTCPKGGERLEASWSYCPWHGVRTE